MTDNKNIGITIKDLPIELRPRERLIANSPSYLSDSELLAILLKTGTKQKTAIHLAETILMCFGDIVSMSTISPKELLQINGIGYAKAAQIIAAFELGRRISYRKISKTGSINCPEDVWELLGYSMRLLDKEFFKAIFLNTKHNIINICDISIGSLNASIVHPREVFKEAIRNNSNDIVIVHNHPSGNPSPSDEDIKLTKRLIQAGKIIGIEVIDHIIIGANDFVSLKEKGLLF